MTLTAASGIGVLKPAAITAGLNTLVLDRKPMPATAIFGYEMDPDGWADMRWSSRLHRHHCRNSTSVLLVQSRWCVSSVKGITLHHQYLPEANVIDSCIYNLMKTLMLMTV